MEFQLEEANSVKDSSNTKHEDANRKLKVVEGDLERIIERAEEFEVWAQKILRKLCDIQAKINDLETQIREQETKVKETEAITIRNADSEDKFETKIARLQEDFKNADTRYIILHYCRLPQKFLAPNFLRDQSTSWRRQSMDCSRP